jgi:uncharacterized protein (TIGR02246 family)
MPSTENVEAVMRAYVETWRRDDMDGWGALFTEDCDFVGWAGQWWRSRVENVAGHKAVPASVARQRSSYSVEIAGIDFVAPDVALVHAVWSWKDFVAPDGAGPVDRRGVLTMVIVRHDDGFRIRASHNARVA